MSDSRTPRAPSGDMPPSLRNGLIYAGGRHLASIRGHELHRTFDSRRELLDGALFFRIDLLKLAVDNGVQDIVVRDRATGKRWRIGIDTFRACGHRYSHPVYGDQWGMSLDEFDPICPPDGLEQFTLWGGGL